MKKPILNVILILNLMFAITQAQQDDDMFLDDVGKEEVVCVPADLSAPADKYSGTISDPIEVAKLYSFGSEYHKNKNYKEALPLLWKVFVNDSGKRADLSIGKIAESYFYEKKIDSTLLACYKGFERYPDNQKLHYFAGYIQNQLGKADCALPHYEAMVEKNPKGVAYLTTLAFLYYKTDDCRSIETQQKVVELAPNDPKAQENLALYMSACGESPRLAYMDAWKKDPTNFRIGRQLSQNSIEEGYFKHAIGVLDTIIAGEPTAIDYQLRSGAYSSISENSKAISDLSKWLKLEPNNADIMLLIATNYTALKQFKSANSWISKAINKKPGYGKPYIIRGEMYEAMVNHCQSGKPSLEDKIVYEEAREVYQQAKKDPGYRGEADRKMKNLESYIRMDHEVFMEPNAKVKNPCYELLIGQKGVKD